MVISVQKAREQGVTAEELRHCADWHKAQTSDRFRHQKIALELLRVAADL
jgi:hypothetical protein